MYNKNILNEEESLIRKYTTLVKQYDDGISLALGEPFLDVREDIINATINSLNLRECKYTNAQGDEELLNKISIYENVDKDELLITAGSSEGIFISLLSILNKDEEVIIITPCYPQYSPVVRFCNGKVVYVDTSLTKFIPTEEQILDAITKSTKAIIINSPSNPTGIVYDYETLKMINSIAKKYNLFIICDDVYEHLVYENKCNFTFDKNLCITLKSFSKTYSMTGYRLGYIIASKNTIKQLLKVHSYLMISVPVFIQKAGLYALDINNFNYDKLKNNLMYIKNTLTKNNIEFINVSGGIFIFLDIRNYHLSSIEFCDLLLEKFHVACVPGEAFMTPGFIRINFAVSSKTLDIATKKIIKFIKQIKD